MIIAIDGPAGSGKSSTARKVAAELGFLFIDTGAMYRAVALAFQQRKMALDAPNLDSILAELSIELVPDGDGLRTLLNGEDVSTAIRASDISDLSSRVSAIAAVRRHLVAEQRRMASARGTRGTGVVLEGRDIGTVVFPDAELKVFMVADPAVRARRRVAEMQARGLVFDSDLVEQELIDRDRRDSERSHSPLRRAQDAIEIDTSSLSFDDQVARIVRLARERA